MGLVALASDDPTLCISSASLGGSYPLHVQFDSMTCFRSRSIQVIQAIASSEIRQVAEDKFMFQLQKYALPLPELPE